MVEGKKNFFKKERSPACPRPAAGFNRRIDVKSNSRGSKNNLRL